MTALNRTVAFGTGEDDEFPDSSLNDNGPAEGGGEEDEGDE